MKQLLMQKLALPEDRIDLMCRFSDALLEKNKVMNLTAITQPEAVAELHFVDSVSILKAADFQGKSVIDIGSGAGFPGVPLLIAEPTIRLTILDSLAKRMNWLEGVLAELKLPAQVLTGRAEELVASCREQFDIAASRAVARLNILAELCLPYVKVGGAFIAMKGQLAEEELKEAADGIFKLGGRVESVYSYPVADAMHKAVIIRKERPTPKQYPRAFAKIKKSPM